jgi:hypothetical protein
MRGGGYSMRRTEKENADLGYPMINDFIKNGDTVNIGYVNSLLGFSGKVDEETRYIQDKNVSDIIGNKGLFHTFARDSIYEPFTYYGQCEAGRIKNRHPEAAKLVFVATPFHAVEEERGFFFQQFAAAAARAVFLDGDIPIMPHLYFPNFMKDDGYEREYGITTGHLLMHNCTGFILYKIGGYVSDGMKSDMEYAASQLALTPEIIELTEQEAEEFIEKTLETEV